MKKRERTSLASECSAVKKKRLPEVLENWGVMHEILVCSPFTTFPLTDARNIMCFPDWTTSKDLQLPVWCAKTGDSL